MKRVTKSELISQVADLTGQVEQKKNEIDFLHTKIKALEKTLNNATTPGQIMVLKYQNEQLEAMLNDTVAKLSETQTRLHDVLYKQISQREDFFKFAKTQAIELIKNLKSNAKTPEISKYLKNQQHYIDYFIFKSESQSFWSAFI
mgnify:CR=1 FL=1